jgi:serine/threonine-protein kinase
MAGDIIPATDRRILVPGSADVIGREIAHYRILDRLGGGGMGVVYKAEDTRLGRTVVLKFVNTELLANESVRRRFLHEARAASVIDHPNVCHVYEVGEAEDGRAYIAMTYCEGRSLRDVIKAGPVPPREAFSIAFGIAQGVWAAHRRGIVHRDIKPGNVILTDEGFVRIVDFGLALLIGDSRVTTSGVTVGTVAYMSPEQTSGSTVAANTDIWSLGVTLYELLTGRLPFRGDVNAALVYSIVHEPHTPLPDSVPPPCARIVDRCLEKDPAKRYQTIEELLEDMVGVARELEWDASLADATIAPILRARRWKILTRRFALGAAALAVVAGGWFAWRELHRHSLYTTKIRVAILPFDNLLGAENETLVDGLSDHIARMTRWVSRGRTSMWATPYDAVVGAQLTKPSDATAAFGVNRIITGDVQRVGEVPRVRLRLADAGSGRVIHEASLPLDSDGPAVIADSLVLVLGSWFDVDPRAMPRGSPWNRNDVTSFRLYLEGLSLLRRGFPKDAALTNQALVSLEQSVARDSSSAFAAYALGSAELSRYRQSPARELLDRALRHGRMARRETPTLTDAHILLAGVFRALDRPDSAEACLRLAANVDPANVLARQRIGDLYVSQNRIQEAESAFLRAVELNRDNWIAQRFLGVFYYNQHRLDDAARAWQDAIKVAPHDVLTPQQSRRCAL